MHIDSYSFGSIQIDGKDYASDVVLLGGDVKSPWWREAGGHVYAVEDFEDLVEAAPDVVVLGTGYFGRVNVLDETIEAPPVITGAILRTWCCLDVAVASGKVTWKILFDGDETRKRYLVSEISDAEAASPQNALDAIIANKLRSARQRYEIRHGSPGRLGLGLPYQKSARPFANDFEPPNTWIAHDCGVRAEDALYTNKSQPSRFAVILLPSCRPRIMVICFTRNS